MPCRSHQTYFERDIIRLVKRTADHLLIILFSAKLSHKCLSKDLIKIFQHEWKRKEKKHVVITITTIDCMNVLFIQKICLSCALRCPLYSLVFALTLEASKKKSKTLET